jgi:oligosaccharyltransferase complex subunit delta (ribophorin II)
MQPYNYLYSYIGSPFVCIADFLCLQENSFLRPLGHLELDLPDAPEKAPRPPAQAVDPFSKFGPKAEISHIFRAPEKRPPKELSLAFTGLTLLPFIGFLIGVGKIVIGTYAFLTFASNQSFCLLRCD